MVSQHVGKTGEGHRVSVRGEQRLAVVRLAYGDKPPPDRLQQQALCAQDAIFADELDGASAEAFFLV